jgi:Tfp pilus assembly protein PilN
MRPVNLIPAEDRRGDRTELRTGAFTYVLIGGLAVLLLAIIGLALTSKSISDKESKKQELQAELDEVTAKAQSLQSFASFSQMLNDRTTTVSSLAQSRFDWERVINELAHIIPSDVWLVNLTGTVSPAVQVQNGAEVSVRDGVPGPALEIIGCTTSEDSVAAFIAALEDIDGVTRVGLAETKQPDSDTSDAGGGTTSDSTQGTDDCRTRDFITQFQLVAAFDSVPTPAGATAAPSTPAPTTPAPAGEGAQPASSTGNLNQQGDSAQQATGVVPGG